MKTHTQNQNRPIISVLNNALMFYRVFIKVIICRRNAIRNFTAIRDLVINFKTFGDTEFPFFATLMGHKLGIVNRN